MLWYIRLKSVIDFSGRPARATATRTGAHLVKNALVLIAFSLTILSVAACSQEKPAREATNLPIPNAANASGKVIETMNTAGYTYVLVDKGSEKIWAAARSARSRLVTKW